MAREQTTVLKPAGHSIGIRSIAQFVHVLFSTIQRRISLINSAVFLVAACAGARPTRRHSRQ
jgi:hypothetical protein